MAQNGLQGNPHLAAPFGYRPAAPLLVHSLTLMLHADPQVTFRWCNRLMCLVLIVSCYYFCRFLKATPGAASLASALVSLYFFTVKWTIFSGEMVDIYAYPLLLLSFVALLRVRSYVCLSICAAGLFVKEFLLLPMLTHAVLAIRETRRQKGFTALLSTTALVLLSCLLLPRLLIHVQTTFQDIDPLNNPKSLKLLLAYPASMKRDFNILFYYVAFWLPVLLLLTIQRAKLLWQHILPYRTTFGVYLAIQFLLVMYGGTNLDVFVTYALPVQLFALTTILSFHKVSKLEKGFVVIVVIVFNRLWMHVPLPDQNMQAYLNFYGGYHTSISAKAFGRAAELLCYLVSFYWIRAQVFSHTRSRSLSAGRCG